MIVVVVVTVNVTNAGSTFSYYCCYIFLVFFSFFCFRSLFSIAILSLLLYIHSFCLCALNFLLNIFFMKKIKQSVNFLLYPSPCFLPSHFCITYSNVFRVHIILLWTKHNTHISCVKCCVSVCLCAAFEQQRFLFFPFQQSQTKIYIQNC